MIISARNSRSFKLIQKLLKFEVIEVSDVEISSTVHGESSMANIGDTGYCGAHFSQFCGI